MCLTCRHRSCFGSGCVHLDNRKSKEFLMARFMGFWNEAGALRQTEYHEQTLEIP
jgi:hypothetical protein